MHGTTRELNFGTIFFVAIVFVLLLITIVAGSTAWFRYEFTKQQQQRAEKYSAYPELAKSKAQQVEHLSGKDSGTNIHAAMKQVAEQY